MKSRKPNKTPKITAKRKKNSKNPKDQVAFVLPKQNWTLQSSSDRHAKQGTKSRRTLLEGVDVINPTEPFYAVFEEVYEAIEREVIAEVLFHLIRRNSFTDREKMLILSCLDSIEAEYLIERDRGNVFRSAKELLHESDHDEEGNFLMMVHAKEQPLIQNIQQLIEKILATEVVLRIDEYVGGCAAENRTLIYSKMTPEQIDYSTEISQRARKQRHHIYNY